MGDLVTTRQSVLRRALALGAGAVGFGAAAGTAAAAGTGAAETDRSRITMRLTARHAETRGGADQRHAVLVDHRGVTVGHLAGTRLPLHSPFGVPAAVSAIELHTLTLDGGTLLAQGALHGSAGTFHLVGGTGRFSGASGSYGFRLGHGTAGLTLTIVTKESA
jgi:hypothetical protein